MTESHSGAAVGAAGGLWRPASVLGAWTLLVWGLRTRNVIVDGDTASGAVIPIVCFLLGACVLVAVAYQSRQTRSGRGRPGRAWIGAAVAVGAFGILYWLVRSIEIAFDDHSVGFIVVHAVLGGVTVVLSVWLLVAARRVWTDAGIAAAGYGLAGAVE